ncbi:unnamed protein product [Musa acuminata subsp. malaccensis]|uniref:(wild Malaysian banana) hypothetical protein n=1 Tax=Musa acuminata subsp. malaccensis TaxID=214687 RepID=A0A804L5S7_MUSAM|nr:unnamed protein product [Musa acuminata subsp. malaccensis]
MASLQLESVICLLCKPIALDQQCRLTLELSAGYLAALDRPKLHLPNNATSNQSLSTSLFSSIKLPHFLHSVRYKDVISLY